MANRGQGRIRVIWLAVVVTSLALSAQAQAQESRDDNSDSLQAIVVTAERREQTVTSVPLSIQATTGAELQQSGIYDLTDLQFSTPGYLPTSGQGYTQIYIRGIGNDISVGADPSVATFVDDVPRIYGSLNENFLDVQRVEVLKGAQGGLYGRNATGGVVNIVTSQPSTDKLDGNVLVDYGEKATFRGGAFVNIPAGDHVAFTMSIERDSHDPYVRNLASSTPYTATMFPTGNAALGLTPTQAADLLNSKVTPRVGYNAQDFWATDDKMLVKLADNFKITVAGDYSAKVDTSGTGNFDTTPAYLQQTLTAILGGFGFNPSLPDGFEKGSNGKFTTYVGDPNFADTWDYGGSITAVWNAPGVDISSISAYRAQTTGYGAGSTAGTAPDATFVVDTHRHYEYQEMRAVSTAAGPFHWLGGATYLANDFDGYTSVYLLGGLATTTQIHSLDTVKNWSVYAQGDYEIAPKLTLTASGRYVHETNHATFTEPADSSSASVEKKFLPSSTLSYALDDGTVYARYAKGFKAGGVNPTAAPVYFPPGSEGSVFGPEVVDTYEVGYRQGLFGHKLEVTTAAFYNNYNGIQTQDHANPAYATDIVQAIINGGSARTYGVEETFSWRIVNPLTLGINAGYLNARYKNFGLSGNAVLADFDLSGQKMLNSPTWQTSFTGALDLPLNGQLRLIGNVLVSHITDVIYQQSNIPGLLPDAAGPAYWLTNARLGVRTSDGKYTVSVFANNLFNAAYYTYGNSAGTGNVLLWGNPRIIGGEITAKF